ncbi:MAG: hypothetical protein JSR78_02925 [Proteobacteria bacterium]|nr:hypothetical protein [Pseudomonadota bacterium]
MNTRAGVVLAGVAALSLWGSTVSAGAQELSEHAVKSFMEYAWSLTPQQFSKPDGSVIVIDKTKKAQVEVPVDVARRVIMAGRLSAHAQICDLRDEQVQNHRALMRREEATHKWTQQQLVYISQLHLTTLMLMTGRIKLVEQEGDKQVVVDEKKSPTQTCTPEQKEKVKELIEAYVAGSPAPNFAQAGQKAPAGAAAAGAPVSTGSTSVSETSVEKK